ncbi:hypothetical protein PVAP13_5KG381114 [Panicum virgatum]|uniref:Uncharacterized protein n=1 Tax=Panicum virgatum TaxID=38727 RepID=A0A8T0SQM4_PANVG|nr:hypothetical protein PVAP13_5KG381114 [Panicum virgatum]
MGCWQLADNKFSMRFPNAKIVLDYSTFRLGMKNSETQMIIEPWTSAIWAKRQLQQAWFKVKGIPANQRSIRTIAKVGGLVGKTMAIDESTHYKAEFVRVKIACRDIYMKYLHQLKTTLACTYLTSFLSWRNLKI